MKFDFFSYFILGVAIFVSDKLKKKVRVVLLKIIVELDHIDFFSQLAQKIRGIF